MAPPIPRDDLSRRTCYRKRAKTLMKKAEELASLCNVKVAAVCRSPSGRQYYWPEDPSQFNDVLDLFHSTPKSMRRRTVLPNGNGRSKTTASGNRRVISSIAGAGLRVVLGNPPLLETVDAKLESVRARIAEFKGTEEPTLSVDLAIGPPLSTEALSAAPLAMLPPPLGFPMAPPPAFRPPPIGFVTEPPAAHQPPPDDLPTKLPVVDPPSPHAFRMEPSAAQPSPQEVPMKPPTFRLPSHWFPMAQPYGFPMAPLAGLPLQYGFPMHFPAVQPPASGALPMNPRFVPCWPGMHPWHSFPMPQRPPPPSQSSPDA